MFLFDEFSLNGMPQKIQRHGMKANGVYGKVDNLRLDYIGNRISRVKEDARLVTWRGSMNFTGPEGEYVDFHPVQLLRLARQGRRQGD